MKRFFILSLIFLLLLSAHKNFAASVSLQTAQAVAIGWYTNYAPPKITDYTVLSSQTVQYSGINTLYIFNFNAGGFVLISADDRMPPIYGYSFTYKVDTTISEHAIALINMYSERSYVDITNNYTNPNASTDWSNAINGIYTRQTPENSFAPLLGTAHSSSWATWSPYFTGAPTYPADHPLLTSNNQGYFPGTQGCVPLAMAQIMRYHKFPITGSGSHTDNVSKTYLSTETNLPVTISGSFSCDFSAQTYNYNNMPYALTYVADPDHGFDELPGITQAQKDEAGKLTYHAGIACDMQWWGIGVDGSHTPQNWATDLETHFKYLPNWQYITPNGATPDGFKDAIRNDIRAGRPVLFRYNSHCIVMDGFELLNFFHKVHGDGGFFDGYFYLFPADNDGIHQILGTSNLQAAIHLEPNPCEVNAYYTQDYNFYGGSLVFWNPINSKRGVNTIHVYTGAQLTINTEVSLLSNAQIIVENGGILNLGSNCKLYNTCNDIWSGNLTIKGGGIVNIQNGAQIYLGGTGKIIVERVGKLIIDGGILTSTSSMWQGIEVWGNPNLVQSDANQGVVELINAATIANAVCGIFAGKSIIDSDGNPATDPAFAGGIVKANGAKFINNQTSISINKFTTNTALNFRSYIKYCEFESNSLNVFSSFVYLSGIDVIKIIGNTFTNTNYSTTNPVSNGFGILSFDANFSVYAGIDNITGNPKPNKFVNLFCGIRAMSSNAMKSFSAQGCEFINISAGIFSTGVNYARIKSNIFDIGLPYEFFSMQNPGMGLYYRGTGFTIEDNEFSSTHNGAIGCIFSGTGSTSNVIYRNRFQNIGVGIQAQKLSNTVSNSGLQIKCNKYISDMTYADVAVASGAIGNPQGLCGSMTTTANNLFSHTSNGVHKDIWVNPDVNPIIYRYYQVGPQSYTQGKVMPWDCANVHLPAFDYNTACPSTLGTSPNPTNLITRIATSNQQLTILSSTIDGGNTQNLLNKIYSNMSPGNLKNALLAPGPYLTDTVLIATIKRPSSLPPGILKNIIVPNSPVTAKVMTALNTVNLPAGIKADIQAVQTGTSARAILEQQISELKQEKDFSVSELMRYYLNDSIIKIDSTILFLKTQTDLDSKKQLVQAYLLKNDCSNASTTLNTLPQQTADDIAFKQFYSIMTTLCTQNKTLFELTPAQLQTITSIAASTTYSSNNRFTRLFQIQVQ
ncbi:MAG: C10 family peptidase [Bacteroidia bacterium]|nr:C10 family peptidase [Bacteroidia bacterium]